MTVISQGDHLKEKDKSLPWTIHADLLGKGGRRLV